MVQSELVGHLTHPASKPTSYPGASFLIHLDSILKACPPRLTSVLLPLSVLLTAAAQGRTAAPSSAPAQEELPPPLGFVEDGVVLPGNSLGVAVGPLGPSGS